MNLKELLPDIVIDYLHDRYVASVADAVAEFGTHRADEDAITGGLGQELSRRGSHVFLADRVWAVQISYQKVRGRGPGAPEKKFGSDGLFQIDVLDVATGASYQKALPFQSKVNWRGKNKKLLEQAILLQDQLGGGLVIDFNASDYKACSVADAIAAGGDRKVANSTGNVKSLGQLLGNEFLDCTIGTEGLIFDPQKESYSLATDLAPPRHLLTTTVRAFRRDERDL